MLISMTEEEKDLRDIKGLAAIQQVDLFSLLTTSCCLLLIHL